MKANTSLKNRQTIALWAPLAPGSEASIAIDDPNEVGGSFAMTRIEIFLLEQKIRLKDKIPATRFGPQHLRSNLVWIRNLPWSAIAELLTPLLPIPSYSLSGSLIVDATSGHGLDSGYSESEASISHGVIVRDLGLGEDPPRLVMTLMGGGTGIMGASLGISDQRWQQEVEDAVTRHGTPERAENLPHIEVLVRVHGSRGWPRDLHVLEVR